MLNKMDVDAEDRQATSQTSSLEVLSNATDSIMFRGLYLFNIATGDV